MCASKRSRAALSLAFLRSRSRALTASMPDTMRSRFLSLISLMPGICLSTERVPMRPITHGISIAKSFFISVSLGTATRLKAAGAGSVSHMASIAASLVCWASPTV